MRDLLEFDPNDFAPAEADPVKRAQALMKRELPKRFYKQVSVEPVEAGFRILLDGRPIRTPAKRFLVLPAAALAETVAAEWQAQASHIDPATMPVTRLSNSVIDAVVERQTEVADDLARYAGTDLLCYRAADPVRLVRRQAEAWDPILDWAAQKFGARLAVGQGVVHVAQAPATLAAIRAALEPLDAWRLAGLHTMTTLMGSAVLALAVLAGRIDADAAWDAAHVDDHWSIELWGADAEALARLNSRRTDYDAALAVLAAGRGAIG